MEWLWFRHPKWSWVAIVDVVSDTFPASLRTWVFWTVSNSRTPPAILKTMSTSSCQLQLLVSKSPPCNCVTILTPNQSLLNKHPYFLPATILILDKQLYVIFQFLPILYKPLPFWSLEEHSSSNSWVCVSRAIVFSLAQIKLFYSYLFIISVDIVVLNRDSDSLEEYQVAHRTDERAGKLASEKPAKILLQVQSC